MSTHAKSRMEYEKERSKIEKKEYVKVREAKERELMRKIREVSRGEG